MRITIDAAGRIVVPKACVISSGSRLEPSSTQVRELVDRERR